jgi:TetR/AcrR family tetracycline transcriptional repressor
MRTEPPGPEESHPVAPAEGRRSAGQRAGVSRDAILAAAIGIVERDGLEQVTMRRLATELGVAPNALYTYFANKSALLDALLDTALAGVRAPDPDDAGWLENLAAIMWASRHALLSHPALVPLLVARPGGRSALRLGEMMVQSLARGGVHGPRAMEAERALLAYMIGTAVMAVPGERDFQCGLSWLLQGIAREASESGEHRASPRISHRAPR